MTLWFTSDLHFGHTNIIEYSPKFRKDLGWTDVQTMNEMLVLMWNKQVALEDEVWILGDMCMGKMDQSLPYISRLNGTKILLPGNHDKMHPSQGTAEKREHFRERYLEVGITDYFDLITYAHFGSDFPYVMCHFPYYGDHTEEERFLNYRPPAEGLPLVHGHVHDDYQFKDRNMMNVGYDAWGRLVHENEVKRFVRNFHDPIEKS